MRNIDRFRAMSLEEFAPYLVKRFMLEKLLTYWYSPSGYIFENYDAAIDVKG